MCSSTTHRDRLRASIEAFRQELADLPDGECLDENQIITLRDKMNDLAVHTIYAAMNAEEQHNNVSLSTCSNDPVQTVVDNSLRSPHVPCLKRRIEDLANTQLSRNGGVTEGDPT